MGQVFARWTALALQHQSREDTVSANKMACTNFHWSLEEHLFVSVRLESNLLDPNAERRYLLKKRFICRCLCPKTDKSAHCQVFRSSSTSLAGLHSPPKHQGETKLRVVFLKQVCKPLATPPQPSVVRAGDTHARTGLGSAGDG